MRKETGDEREEQQFYEGDVASPSYYLKHVVPITHSLVTDLLTMFITECVYMRTCVRAWWVNITVIGKSSLPSPTKFNYNYFKKLFLHKIHGDDSRS